MTRKTSGNSKSTCRPTTAIRHIQSRYHELSNCDDHRSGRPVSHGFARIAQTDARCDNAAQRPCCAWWTAFGTRRAWTRWRFGQRPCWARRGESRSTRAKYSGPRNRGRRGRESQCADQAEHGFRAFRFVPSPHAIFSVMTMFGAFGYALVAGLQLGPSWPVFSP